MASDGVVAGVFALRRESDVNARFVERARYFQAERIAGFEQRNDDLFGGAGVGGAFEDNELALMDVRRDGLYGSDDVAEVRFVIFVQGRGHADDDGVHVGDL